MGPPLFLLSADDLTNAFENCMVHHFTDDTYLIYGNKDPSKIPYVMNNVLLIGSELISAL